MALPLRRPVTPRTCPNPAAGVEAARWFSRKICVASAQEGRTQIDERVAGQSHAEGFGWGEERGRTLTLSDVIRTVADGFSGVAPGVNGPWRNPQTPARNSAHWLVLFGWVYSMTNNRQYLDTIASLAERLVSTELRPHGYAFYNLSGHSTNQANGLIGQAWVFDALAEATRALENDKYAAVAEEVFLQHPFSEQHGLWNSLEPDGRIAPLHRTLNQQLWFAATAACLPGPRSSEIRTRATRFMDRLDRHLHVLGKGLLGMRVRSLRPTAITWARRAVKAAVRRWPQRIEQLGHLISSPASKMEGSPVFSYLDRSIGYHSFTLYGMTLLKAAIPDHRFWGSHLLQRALQWTLSAEYKRDLERSSFAFGYNPTGFEVPRVLSVFRPQDTAQLAEQCQWWIQEQVRQCYNPATRLLDRNTPDPATLTARLYEATRLPDWLLETCVSDLETRY